MRAARGLLLALGALASPALPLGFEEARHLLARAGFGGTPEEIAALAPKTWEQAVDGLLAGMRTEPSVAPPAWVDEVPQPPGRFARMLPEGLKAMFRGGLQDQQAELKAWWYREMVETPSPLTERLTLFWHGHFTSSLQKVRFPQPLYWQNRLFRTLGAGSFRELLHAIPRDPAMIAYLDNQTNRRGKPNENFARELLELFTLGEGHYGEQDIKEAARAFTGWWVNADSGKFWVPPGAHDGGPKTFLGRRGPLDGDDVVEAILATPRAAEFLVTELWKEFVSDAPDPAEVARLAAGFRADWQMKPLLRAMFLSKAFRDPATRGTRIKSPVALVVGTVRVFGLPVEDGLPLVRAGRVLGQDLFDPPNVKGWPGGKSWITSATWLLRRELLTKALRGIEAIPIPPAVYGLEPREILRVLLPIPPVEPLPRRAARWEAIRQIVLDPAYQLE